MLSRKTYQSLFDKAFARAVILSILFAAAPLALCSDYKPSGILSAGGDHTLFIKSDGTVWSWGANSSGQLGNGTVSTMRASPGQVTNLAGVTGVSAGYTHSVAVKADGTVWSWGNNSYGQLGTGTNSPQSSAFPVRATGLNNVISVAAGSGFSLALKPDGTVWSWGYNESGRLGNNSTNNSHKPVHITQLSNIVAIAAGGSHGLALTKTNTVFAWGDNSSGQLGDNTQIDRLTPVRVLHLTNVASIAGGGSFSIALLQNGTVRSWGANGNGQLGIASSTPVFSKTNLAVANLTNILTIECGRNHAFALGAETNWSWGQNTTGQVGNGATNSPVYTPFGDENKFLVAVAGGTGHSVGLRSGGTLISWGANNLGQCGIGTTDSPKTSIVGVPLLFEKYDPYAPFDPNLLAQCQRFTRGTDPSATNFTYKSFVIPLDFQKGMRLNEEGSSSNLFPGRDPWFLRITNDTRWHFRASGPTGTRWVYTNLFGTNYYVPFSNPMVAFGSSGGGSPLYTNQQYSFGIYAGARYESENLANDIRILVFNRSTFDFAGTNNVPVATNNIGIPRKNTAAWTEFSTNGFRKVAEANGLRTTVRLVEGVDAQWGASVDGQWGASGNSPYILTHVATSSSYYYVIECLGKHSSKAIPMVFSNVTTNSARQITGGTHGWSTLYTLDFDIRPEWRSSLVDQPRFDALASPPSYDTNGVSFQASVNLSGTEYISLGLSPDVLTNSTLDRFVKDMGNDPLALAAYVHNEIDLEPLSTGNFSTNFPQPLPVAGIRRNALGVFLEKQGSPWEQCELLIYLLRKAGYHAGYALPKTNNLAIEKSRLSKLLRTQLSNSKNGYNQDFAPQTLLKVDWPWVIAEIDGNDVHLFPWLKDTEIIEGFNLYNYMPENYDSGSKWVNAYLTNDPAINSLIIDDDTPSVLFPKFVQGQLKKHGLSLDDVGVQIRNRRKTFSRWQDFPKPDSFSGEFLHWSAPPDLYYDETILGVYIDSNPDIPELYTRLMRTSDLLNRRFLVGTTNGGSTFALWLAPFSSDYAQNGVGSFGHFTTNPNWGYITNSYLRAQQLSTTNVAPRYYVSIQSSHNYFWRTNVNGTWTNGISYRSTWRPFWLGNTELAGVCINVGRVTRETLEVQAKEYWRTEQRISQGLSVNAYDYEGIAAYMMGMQYYQKVSEFEELNGRLHKTIHPSGTMWIGLARLEWKNGQMLPNVDMPQRFFADLGNATIHNDSGNLFTPATEDYRWIALANASAQEHNAINHFFRQKDAISTVKLLRIADKNRRANPSWPGVIQLTANNYKQKGALPSAGYGNTNLSNFDRDIWTQIEKVFTTSGSNYASVFITPGNIANATGSYRGMGALIQKFNTGEVAALISDNRNGGTGEFAENFSSAQVNYVLVSEPGGFSFYNNDSSTPTTAISSPTTATAAIVWNESLSGNIVWDPFQQQSANQLSGIYSGNTTGDRLTQALNGGNPGEKSWYQTLKTFVADPVNIMSGEFYIDTVDLSLPGPMPLQIRRNYSSQNLADNEFGFGWKMNYMPYLTLSTNSNVKYIRAVLPEGSVVVYREVAAQPARFIPLAADNPSLNNDSTAGRGGTANWFNSYITNYGTSPIWYELKTPDGGFRKYQVRSFPVTAQSVTLQRARPYLDKWQDSRGNSYSFEYGTDSTATDYGEVRRITSTNGNFLGFYYNAQGHITEAYTRDGRRLYYQYDDYGDLTRVTLPDASEITYEYEKKSFTTNSVKYFYSTHLLIKETKPDGRILENIYDTNRCVKVQKATVGLDLNTYTNGQFTYSYTDKPDGTRYGTTWVKDAFGNTTTYKYTNSLITEIIDPLWRSDKQQWFFTDTAGGYRRSLMRTTDKRGLITEFKYDTNGNVTAITNRGNITGTGKTNEVATSTFTYNSRNLLTTSTDPLSKRTTYEYDTTFPYLAKNIIWLSTSSKPSTNHYEYTNVITATEASFGLKRREMRAWGSSDASTNQWTYDARGFVTEEVKFTGWGPDFTNYFLFNWRGELIESRNTANRTNRFDYDARGNLKWRTVFAENGNTLSRECNYYNGNGEVTWTDGARSNPEDYIWRDYDGAGRKIQEIRWRSRAKTNRTGVEAETGDDLFSTVFYEYDKFGNLVRIIDQLGRYTRMDYDALGQLRERRSYDKNSPKPLKIERFEYEPGGLVSVEYNPLGGKTTRGYTSSGKPYVQYNPDGSILKWTYYLDGRLKDEKLANDSAYVTKYDDVNRMEIRTFSKDSGYNETRVFDLRGNLIRTTNSVKAVFTTEYDRANRVKASIGPSSGVGRQQTTNFYAAAGEVITNANRLGEKTITYFDALGRETKQEIRDSSNARKRVRETLYSSDHHSITTLNGSGASQIKTVVFTDTFGKTLITQTFPSAGQTNFAFNVYDVVGNLASSSDFLARKTINTFDGLNRLVTQKLPDGTTLSFAFDPAGNLTNRTMPRSLVWSASYDSANRITSEKLTGLNGTEGRKFSYSYYPKTGLLQNKVETGRGITHKYFYDDYLRLVTRTGSSSIASQTYTNGYVYDLLGRLTSLTQSNAAPFAYRTKVNRFFDGYGNITKESVYTDGGLQITIDQLWDSAGRRTNLTVVGAGRGKKINFDYRADGLMTKVLQGTDTSGSGSSYEFSFDYRDNGLLSARESYRRDVLLGRDGAGRLTAATNLVLNGANMYVQRIETLTWNKDSTLSNYWATHMSPPWVDSRSYSYDTRARVTDEVVGIPNNNGSYEYDFDGNSLGVLLSAKMDDPDDPYTNKWSYSALDDLGRVVRETWSSDRLVVRASGKADATSVSATLNGTNITVTFLSAEKRWYSDLTLTPGNHTLIATATGSGTKKTTNLFTVAASVNVTNYFDGSGNLTNRWMSGNKTNSLLWDGEGRLARVQRRGDGGKDYNWTAMYDGFGRRVATLKVPVLNGIANPTNGVRVDSFYDPNVEFLEIGVCRAGALSEGGTALSRTNTTWIVHGPDLNGVYGGLNGVGGMEATIQESSGAITAVVNDSFGNVIGTITNIPGTTTGFIVSWSPTRVSGYGPVTGYKAPELTAATTVAETSVWRSKRIDDTGLYYLGARYYDPLSRRFISPDPYGHAGSMSLYDFANGDPVNGFDADGRVAKNIGNDVERGNNNFWSSVFEAGESVYNAVRHPVSTTEAAINGLSSLAGQASVDPGGTVRQLWHGVADNFNDPDRASRFMGSLTMAAMPVPPVLSTLRNVDRVTPDVADNAVWRVGRHDDMPSPRPPGTESHHGVNNVWMEANVQGYKAGDAPAILMENEPFHNATRGVFNRVRSEIAARQGVSPRNIDWSQVPPGTAWRLAEEQLQAAKTPANVQAEYFRQFNQYLDSPR